MEIWGFSQKFKSIQKSARALWKIITTFTDYFKYTLNLKTFDNYNELINRSHIPREILSAVSEPDLANDSI